MARRVATLGPLLLTAACIIPDNDILIEGEFENRRPVRIVETLELTDEAEEACADEVADLTRCPQPPPSLQPHFLDPTLVDFQFCSCAEGEDDTNALRTFSFFAEDADEPRDSLFGVFLLDIDPDSPDPITVNTDYPRYWESPKPAPDALPSDYDDAIGRPQPQLREFKITDGTQRVDLCNGNKTTESLGSGFHTLQFLVTDREWFAAVIKECPNGGNDCKDSDKVPKKDEDGEIERAPAQIGVPDLAAGATFDLITYVFHCYDGVDVDAELCQDQCAAPDEEGG